MAIRLITLWLFVSLSAVGQLVTLPSLDVLLARTPIRNETVSVASGLASNDWGGVRLARHYTNNSAFSTNLGNVFQAKGATNGQWVFLDRTNGVQRLSWWGGGPSAADNTKALTNAANHVAQVGGGFVKAGGGAHAFLYGGIVMPSGVRLIGDGPNSTVFDFTSATPAYNYEPVISWIGTGASTVKLQSVPTAGDRSIVLSSSVDWANGDLIQLSDTNQFSFGSRIGYHQGELNVVYSNTGGTNIALVEPLEAAYPTATTTLNKITPTVGSAEGIHFALATTSGAVLLRYADSRSYLRNCSAAGTEESHFWIDSCYGVTAEGLTVDWDSDPSVGLNYGLVFGDSEYLLIQNCFLRSARHGISSGGSSIPTRYCRIVNSTFGSTRQNVPGADLHEDTVETTFDGCTLLSGVSLGGGRNRVLNSTIRNGYDYPAIATSSAYYYDWEVRGNRFLLSSFDASAQSVWAMRFYLNAGSQSGQPASTNYWPGTWGGTSGQTIKIIDNEIQFTGVRTNSNFGIFIDEAATLTANTNITAAEFGGVIITGNRIIPSPDQPFAQDESSGIHIYTRDKVRFRNVIIENNPLLYSASPAVRVHTGDVSIRNNIFRDLLNKDGVLVLPPAAGSVYGTLDVDISDNLFDRPIGSAAVVLGTQGRVVMRRNRVINHGLINTGYSRYGLAAYDGSDPISSAELYDNFVSSTNSPSYDVYISTAAGTLREERTQIGGSVTAGTRSAGGGYLRAPYSLSNFGATNAWTAVGQFAAAPASPFPGIGMIASEPWFYDGTAFDRLRGWGDTNFANIYVTNTITAGALIEAPRMTTTTNLSQTLWATNAQAHFLLGRTLSIADAWPVPNNAVPSTYPLYVFASTNAFSRTAINNYSTGASAGTGLQLFSSGGALGWLAAWGTNSASGNVKARLQMRAEAGAGMAFDLAYPNSQDLVYTYSGGTEFARLSTDTFSLPGVITLAPTNVPTHVAIFDADPTSTRRLLKSVTPANLKNTLAIVSTDISDSTSAGRALLTATDVAAQRTSLGLGTLAVINDAPSDGFGYVRSNAAWARQSGGGSGGVTTNLDNLTVTNTVRFGGNFYVTDAVGGTNRFAIISDSVNSYVQFTSFGDLAVSGGAGLYASSTNNWFYNGLKQYWSGTSDLVWLTSLGFKNATPLRAANILDSTTIDWTTSGTNVTPSIKSQSISTNLIDSTFYSLLMLTNTGSGSTTTNRLVKSLYQNGSSLTIADTQLSEKSIMTNMPSWCVTNFASGYWTTDKSLHVEASGTFTAAADWSGNVIRVKLGSYVLSYTFDEPDSTTPTDAAWRIVADIQVSAAGTNATVAGVGSLIYYQGTAATMLQSGVIAAVPSGTLDTTVQNTLSVTYDNDGTQPLTFKVHSLFAEEKGAEILTSGGSGSSSSASLVSVNGTTNNWNFNSSTPAASSGYRNLTLATSTTNVVVRDRAPYFLTTTLTGTNNSAAEFVVFTNTIAAGWLTDGSRTSLSGLARYKNNTGANRVFLIYVFVGTNKFTLNNNNQASTSTVRGIYYDAEIYRNGSTLFVTSRGATDSAPSVPPNGSYVATTAVASPDAPTWSVTVPDPDANALPISVSMLMEVASANFWATNVFTHLTQPR